MRKRKKRIPPMVVVVVWSMVGLWKREGGFFVPLGT